jgi:hypothetical protein
VAKGFVAPDAAFCLLIDDGNDGFQSLYGFLEIELGWKNQPAVKQRLERYVSLCLSGVCRRELGYEHFPVLLFLFPTYDDSGKEIGAINMARHSKILRKILTRINPDLRDWENIFRCGFSCVDIYAKDLDIMNCIDPVVNRPDFPGGSIV